MHGVATLMRMPFRILVTPPRRIEVMPPIPPTHPLSDPSPVPCTSSPAPLHMFSRSRHSISPIHISRRHYLPFPPTLPCLIPLAYPGDATSTPHQPLRTLFAHNVSHVPTVASSTVEAPPSTTNNTITMAAKPE
ncbi:hypothetical protein BDN71DRAFT_1171010 [Pleurotus eryngii]|uniref:Uncharacterized protein n=1 Tax=Pleurotus eryngii TaxID=5323 RepID=A0A9P5ZT79_PLEER|nr:hypothetical protein BDN71DRAFT_1171010 [Pleurotus eryngii]